MEIWKSILGNAYNHLANNPLRALSFGPNKIILCVNMARIFAGP
ncbi:MAG: hypothetical protein XE04_1409 [Marinimicrobia bacterium 46_43]|jgi:hypothetical protein|nr:MAG: hypothetical protein XE04_1409 [Marinimicrobia bacterium 46_43]